MRFWAYLLDLLVIGSINGIVVYPIFRALNLSLNDANMFAPVSIVTAIIFYAYFVLMTRYFGQTLGKMVFGLRVISLNDPKLSWRSHYVPRMDWSFYFGDDFYFICCGWFSTEKTRNSRFICRYNCRT